MRLAPVEVLPYTVDVNGKDPLDVLDLVRSLVFDFADKIVTLRFVGTLSRGGVAEIDFAGIYFYLSDAYCVLRNTSGVQSPSVSEIVLAADSADAIESVLLAEQKSKLSVFADEEQVASRLLAALNCGKQDGETNASFEERLRGLAKEVLE